MRRSITDKKHPFLISAFFNAIWGSKSSKYIRYWTPLKTVTWSIKVKSLFFLGVLNGAINFPATPPRQKNELLRNEVINRLNFQPVGSTSVYGQVRHCRTSTYCAAINPTTNWRQIPVPKLICPKVCENPSIKSK